MQKTYLLPGSISKLLFCLSILSVVALPSVPARVSWYFWVLLHVPQVLDASFLLTHVYTFIKMNVADVLIFTMAAIEPKGVIMAIAGKREYASHKSSRFSLAKAFVLISLLLVVASIGLGAYFILTPGKTTTSVKTTVTVQPQQIVPAAMTDQMQVSSIGKHYMNALLQQQYATMWSMLHPQVQNMWPGKTSFITYWKARFHGYTLQRFTSGSVNKLSFWTNPETMVQYNNVYALPISLQIQSQAPPAQQKILAPQFQHPGQLFQNLPFIVQHVNSANGGQWLVLNGGPADLESPILPPAAPLYRTAAVPILMYHHIANVLPTTDLLDRSLTVTPTIFTDQLDYLKKMDYHTITLNQLMDALYYGAPLPRKPIILTFDDGYDDAYNFAYPLLKAHGFTGMFYIITGKVGWRGQASWSQLKEMLANGMQMGSHTIHHVDMGATYLASPMQAQQEAQISQETMQRQLDVQIQHFCYPNGGPFKGRNLVLQREVVALLAKNGYVSATTDPGPTGVIQSSLASLALLRLRIDGRESLFQFINTLPPV